MTQTELLQEGINLMLVGIGFVMAFLLVLIYAIGAMSKIVNRFFSEPNPTPSPIAQDIAPQHNELDQLRPVIVAAILHHRRIHGGTRRS